MKFKCKYCECETDYKVFVPFKNPAYRTVRDPKWAFHIAQVCFNCHKHVTFLSQTDELMAELGHAVLMKLDVQDREIPPEK